MSSPVYACTTRGCEVQFAGFCDERTFCSICGEDLTEIAHTQVPVEELNELLASSASVGAGTSTGTDAPSPSTNPEATR